MPQNVSSEESVLFRITRERTTVFHPDRSVSVRPYQTGEELELPRSIALYHVKNGVGVIVEPGDEGAEETETQNSEAPTSEVPVAITEEPKVEEPKVEVPKAPAKRTAGRPAAAK